jgi:hypothetical protein
MVFFYTWVDAQGSAGHLFAVVGDNDQRHSISATDGVPVGERDFDDWEVAGLRVRHTQPLRIAELSFDGDGVSYQATFTGLHDAFSYRDNADGCPTFVADDRFEQSGHVTGTLVLQDRTIEFDTTAHRDHSWGTRDWDTLQDWKWISAQAGDDLALHVMLVHGRGETTRHGYVWRDGSVVPILDVRAKAQYDHNWWQTRAHITIRDSSTRETVVTAERFALLRFEAGEKIVLNEAGCRGTIDGEEALVHFEAGWDRFYAETEAQRTSHPG